MMLEGNNTPQPLSLLAMAYFGTLVLYFFALPLPHSPVAIFYVCHICATSYTHGLMLGTLTSGTCICSKYLQPFGVA
jgi:hypothetical protein